MSLSPADVGRRVSLRRRLGQEHGRPVYGDVVGHLLAWEHGALRVRRRDGSVVRVFEHTVVAGKVVPPAPATRRRRAGAGSPPASADPADRADRADQADRARPVPGPEHLERVAAAGWRAPETASLGDWLLRAAGGFTGRANSALAVGDPATDLDTALAHVRTWYGRRGLPPRVQVVTGSPHDAAAAARGWTLPAAGLHSHETHVQTAPLPRVLAAVDDTARGEHLLGVRVHDAPDEAWLGLYRAGTPLSPVAVEVLAGHPRVGFASLGDAPRLAVGRVVVDEGWAGLSAVEVAPRARRRGHARAVVATLLRWAAERGAEQVYLQVSAGNTPAMALYASLGFTTHHTYVYRVPRDASGAA